MLAERIPTQVLSYDTNLKDQILHETTFSAITDPCNRWKALEHKEPVKSTGKVAKHRQSDKSREKLSEGRVTSAGKVTRREKSDNKQERVDKAREE